MAVVNEEREIKPWEPKAIDRLWIHRCDPLTRKIVNAALNALPQVAAEHNRNEILEAVKAIEFNGSIGDWGADAVKRGRAGEVLSAADWNALAQCAKAMSENEAREKDAR